jgi:hypothetical protein
MPRARIRIAAAALSLPYADPNRLTMVRENNLTLKREMSALIPIVGQDDVLGPNRQSARLSWEASPACAACA